eukprot:Gb_37919 [translate_table: standard]
MELKQETKNVSGLQQSTMESKQEVEIVSALQDATMKPEDGTYVNSIKDIESLKGEVTSLKSRIMEMEGRLKVNEALVGISVLYLQSAEDLYHQILFLEMEFSKDISSRSKAFMNWLKSVRAHLVGVFAATVTGKDDDSEDGRKPVGRSCRAVGRGEGPFKGRLMSYVRGPGSKAEVNPWQGQATSSKVGEAAADRCNKPETP